MHRRDEGERAAPSTPPPPPLLPAARLYIHDAPSLATRSMHIRSDDHTSKHSSLRSVSPTTKSSTRDLAMRAWNSHSTSSDSSAVSVHDHSRVRHHAAANYPHTHHKLSIRTAPTSAPVARPPPSKLKAQVAKVLYRPDTDDNGLQVPHDELQQIKDSVERLRAQRTHVEQLRERNERLELLLADRAKEIDKLRLQLVSMQGVEQENVGLLKSFELLEQRIHALEATCHERKEDVRIANERLAASDKAHATLQLRVDELAGEREYLRQQLGTVQSAHESRVRELQASHDRALESERRDQSEWQRKAQELELAQSHVEHKFQDELAQRQSETEQLVQENRAMEQRVQQLLATTVRQTTMIEDCDRLLRESKSRHETAKASYRDQLQLNAGLQTQIKELEIKLSTREQGLSQEKTMLEAKLAELETKARKLKDKNAIYVVALQEKEALCEKLQSELLVRDRARFHVEDVVKELRQKEKALLSEISTLKVALTDLADEKSILQDQLGGLREQLEKERVDRSRWATARLKLLAEFCDEENKLNTALHPFPVMEVMTDDGLEDLEMLGERGFGDGDDASDESGVDTAVAAAGLKMDALDRRLLGHPAAHARIHQRPMQLSKPIVFG